MQSKRLLTILSVISGGLICWFALGWLFLGIFRDREFGEKHLFIKHRPSFKFNFRAPLGESDYTLSDLDPERRFEEVMYREFVEEGGGYGRSIALPEL